MIDMELGPIRPPSEAESLMLRVTRGCHWNKCYFCDLYKKYKFSRRRYEEIEEDLKKAADSEYAQNYTTCFLQDGDAFVLQTEFLMQILEGIHKYLPNIKHVTTYARADSIARKSVSELRELKTAGIEHLYCGMETGSDLILRKINKGFDAATIIISGNSFYPNVKNVQEFIVKSNKLLKKSRPTYIDATCSTQVLFPMISILGKALSGFHTWKLQTIDSVNSKFPFKVLSGEIRGIPAIVKIQNQLDPKDPDNNGFLLHRIVLGTTEGSLCLDNSNGLVIWNPQMYVPHAEGVLDMYGNNSYVELPVSEVADGVRNTTYAEVYKELWPEGIVCALNDFARAITDNSQKNIMAQQMLTISEIWKDLSEKIGSPQLIVTPERNGIRLADIAE